jgi:hypothetical protein
MGLDLVIFVFHADVGTGLWMSMIVCVAAISKMETRQTLLQYVFSTALLTLAGPAVSVGVYLKDVRKIRMSLLLLSIFNVGVVQKYVQCCIAVYIE